MSAAPLALPATVCASLRLHAATRLQPGGVSDGCLTLLYWVRRVSDGCLTLLYWVRRQVHNGVESDNVELIRAHNTVLDHLSKQNVVVPEALLTQGARGGFLSAWHRGVRGMHAASHSCPCSCLSASHLTTKGQAATP